MLRLLRYSPAPTLCRYASRARKVSPPLPKITWQRKPDQATLPIDYLSGLGPAASIDSEFDPDEPVEEKFVARLESIIRKSKAVISNDEAPPSGLEELSASVEKLAATTSAVAKRSARSRSHISFEEEVLALLTADATENDLPSLYRPASEYTDIREYFTQYLPYIRENTRLALLRELERIDVRNLKPISARIVMVGKPQDGTVTIMCATRATEFPKLNRTFSQELVCIRIPGTSKLLDSEINFILGVGNKIMNDSDMEGEEEDVVEQASVRPKYGEVMFKVKVREEDYARYHAAASALTTEMVDEANWRAVVEWNPLIGLIPPSRIYSACQAPSTPAFLSDIVNRQPVPWPTDLTTLEVESIEGVAQAQLPDDRPLNPTQLSVVTRLAATSAGGLYSLIGPPGTGKTHTIVHLLAERVRNFPEQKILLTAPSNKAVHVVLSQLLRKIERPPLVAFTGVLRNVPRHLEEVVASEYGYFLNQLIVDAITSNETLGKKVVDLNAAFQELDARLTRLISAKGCAHVQRRKEQSVTRLHRYVKRARVTLGESNFTDEAELQHHVQETTLIIDRAKHDLEDYLLSKCQVLFSTLTASGRKGLAKVLGHFDTVFVDEASQAIVPETFIPFKFNPKLYVLIGDPQQLPGTVAHTLANKGFADSLMGVMTQTQKRPHVEMLTTQYRMHPSINKWISDSFYDGELVPDGSLSSRASALDTLPPNMLLSGVPSAFVDVEGTEEREQLGSICNKREAEVIVATVKFLLKNGVRPEQIGIITFYAAQARVLSQQLYELETALRKEAVSERSRRKRLALQRVRRGELSAPEGADWDIVAGIPKITTEGMVVSTVDSFQGDERDFTLISCVRTSPSVGFLNDHRRVNVAMSRAKHARWVFGASEVLRKSNSMFRDFFHWESREGKNCVQPPTRVVRCEDLLQSIGMASVAEHSGVAEHSDASNEQQECAEAASKAPGGTTGGLPLGQASRKRPPRKSPATPRTPKPFTYDVPDAAMYKFPDDWW